MVNSIHSFIDTSLDVPSPSPESHEPEFNTGTHNESNIRFRNGVHVTSISDRVNRDCVLGNDINPNSNDNSQGKRASSLCRCKSSPDFENHNQESDNVNSVVFLRKIANVSSCFFTAKLMI